MFVFLSIDGYLKIFALNQHWKYKSLMFYFGFNESTNSSYLSNVNIIKYER